MSDFKKSICCICVLVIGIAGACAQETHYNATSGDWSVSGNWTNGQPDSSTNAIIGSDSGSSSATVYVTQLGETCNSLFLGLGEGNQGNLVVNSGASLMAAGSVYVGYEGVGQITQNGGEVSMNSLQLGGVVMGETYGLYYLEDGSLTVSGWLSVDPERSTFVQRGGSAVVHAFDGRTDYRKQGGALTIQTNVIFNSIPSAFQQSGGETIFEGDVSFEYGGYLNIAGGSLRIDGNLNAFNISPGEYPDGACSVSGTLSVGGDITTDNTIEFGCSYITRLEKGFFNKCTYSQGQDWINKRFSLMHLLLEGGSQQISHIEAAGKDIGAIEKGFEDNFDMAQLTIGGDDVSYMQLVNGFDNQTEWSGEECLYVDTLVLNAGSTLDLNGLMIYYRDGSFDPAGTILYNGGNLIQVPEPTSICLLTIVFGTILRNRRK